MAHESFVPSYCVSREVSSSWREGRLAKWVIPGLIILLAVCSMAPGVLLAQHGRLDDGDNLLFQSDGKRVIENSTSLSGTQERARIHPLHVLMLAPIGQMLSWLLGSATLATVLITAVAAAWVLFNVDRVLRRHLELTLGDRVLFVLLLGASASHLTFTMVPDTHVLSALGLSGMAAALTPDRLERLRGTARSYLEWLRAGGAASLAWGVVAVGILGTSIALVPVLVFVQLPPSSALLRRLLLAVFATFSVLATVVCLHLAQRAVWPPVRPIESATANSFAPATATPASNQSARSVVSSIRPGRSQPPPSTGDGAEERGAVNPLVAYVRKTWKSNARYLTPPGELHERLGQVALAVFVNTFFPPHLVLHDRWWTETAAASFEPWAFDHRLPGVVGLAFLLLWLVSIAIVLRSGSRALPKPLLLFSGSLILFYASVVFLYGDELFLYSPNWAFAVVLVVAALYAAARTAAPAKRQLGWGLAAVVACLLINSAFYIYEFLSNFL